MHIKSHNDKPYLLKSFFYQTNNQVLVVSRTKMTDLTVVKTICSNLTHLSRPSPFLRMSHFIRLSVRHDLTQELKLSNFRNF